jgi:hypothetical protein
VLALREGKRQGDVQLATANARIRDLEAATQELNARVREMEGRLRSAGSHAADGDMAAEDMAQTSGYAMYLITITNITSSIYPHP